MHLTERITLLDKDTLKYEATVTDPKNFSKSWSVMMPLNRDEKYLDAPSTPATRATCRCPTSSRPGRSPKPGSVYAIWMKKSGSQTTGSPSQLIDAQHQGVGRLARHDARPAPGRDQGTLIPASSKSGSGRCPCGRMTALICTGETYKSAVKLTFAKGAALKDPAGPLQCQSRGNTRRAIDFREGETINENALKALIRAA
jgi:hypothetical protein